MNFPKIKASFFLSFLLIHAVWINAFAFAQTESGQVSISGLRNKNAWEKLQTLPECKLPLFDNLPLKLSDFRAFRPLGFLSLPIHIFGAKHSSFTINLPGENASKPVFFPGKAWVTLITTTSSARHGKGYQLTFYPCRTFKAYFFHLKDMPSPIELAFNQASPECREFNFDGKDPILKCEAEVWFQVRSGEPAGNSDGSGGVDLGAVDYTAPPHDFANPERYDRDYLHYVSPIPYFTKELQPKLESKLGSYDGSVRRTAEPRTGSLLQDIKGTAQGNWFIHGRSFLNTQDLSPFLALVHDYVDPSQPVFSMGNSVPGVPIGLYSFKPKSTGFVNRDFSQVKPDGRIYCYDHFVRGKTAGGLQLGNLDGVLLLSMPNATSLKVEKAGSDDCQSIGVKQMSKNAAAFER